MIFVKSNIKTLTCLLVVLIIASFLRFYNLEKWGPIFYDEGQYLSEAIYSKDVITWSAKLAFQLPFTKDKAALIDRSVHSFNPKGQALKTGRPMHNLVMVLGAFVFSNNLNWGNLTLATVGILNIILTFFLAKLVTGSNKTSLLAASITALLPIHVFYSRLTMAEMDSQFFFLISLIMYINKIRTGKTIYWFFTSIFIALAVITNGDRFAFITPIITEAIYYRKQAVKRIAVFFIILITTFTLCELPYHLAYLLSHNYNLVVTNPSYLEQELWILARLSAFGTIINFASLFSYPYMIVSTTGLLFCILLVLGLTKTYKSQNKIFQFIFLSIVLTLLFQSIHTLKAIRAISPLLPLFGIMAAIGFNFLSSLIKKIINNILMRRSILSGILFFALIELFNNSIPLLSYASPYQKTIAFLTEHKAKIILTTGDAIFRAINPNIQTVNYQNSFGIGNLKEGNNKNPDYIITTAQKFTIPTKAINLSKTLDTTTTKIENKCTPEVSFSDINSPILLRFFVYEHNSSIQTSIDFINNLESIRETNIDIYKYDTCFQKI